jgi:hypothetical protein
MKYLLYCLIVISLALAAYVAYNQFYPGPLQGDDALPLSKFILGSWDGVLQAATPGNGYSLEDIQFISENKLGYHMTGPGEDYVE